jgi:hypothetical protein
VKLALDVWYELWERAGDNGGPGRVRDPGAEYRPNPWPEEYRTWIGGQEPRSGYYALLGQPKPR